MVCRGRSATLCPCHALPRRSTPWKNLHVRSDICHVPAVFNQQIAEHKRVNGSLRNCLEWNTIKIICKKHHYILIVGSDQNAFTGVHENSCPATKFHPSASPAILLQMS